MTRSIGRVHIMNRRRRQVAARQRRRLKAKPRLKLRAKPRLPLQLSHKLRLPRRLLKRRWKPQLQKRAVQVLVSPNMMLRTLQKIRIRRILQASRREKADRKRRGRVKADASRTASCIDDEATITVGCHTSMKPK